MPDRSSALTPAYTYSESAARYRNAATGQFVPAAAVRAALDETLVNAGKATAALSQQLREGTLPLKAWQAAMTAQIKSVHLASSALARGGWAQMTPADLGRVAQTVREQLGFLRGFAEQVTSGKRRLDGRFLERARQYIKSGRETYERVRQGGMRMRGFDQERNTQHSHEGCASCAAESAREWVGLGELVPIGQRTCLHNCLCSVSYRNSQTGAVAA